MTFFALHQVQGMLQRERRGLDEEWQHLIEWGSSLVQPIEGKPYTFTHTDCSVSVASGCKLDLKIFTLIPWMLIKISEILEKVLK
jgi:hypothetical protein